MDEHIRLEIDRRLLAVEQSDGVRGCFQREDRAAADQFFLGLVNA